MAEQGRIQFVDDEALVDLLYTALEVAHAWDCECAWCLKEAGIPPGEKSHGICEHHREEEYAKYKSRR